MTFINDRLMEALWKLADLFIISLLWLLVCIPVITIIPATIAMYYTVVKVVRRQEGYPVRTFFTGFSQNIKHGLIVSVLYFILGLFFYFIYIFVKTEGITYHLSGVYIFFLFVVIFCLISISLYFIPILSRFHLKLTDAVKLAIGLTFKNILTVVPLTLTLIGVFVVAYIFPPIMLVLPAGFLFLVSYSVEKALVSYIKEYLDYSEHKNMWYMKEE